MRLYENLLDSYLAHPSLIGNKLLSRISNPLVDYHRGNKLNRRKPTGLKIDLSTVMLVHSHPRNNSLAYQIITEKHSNMLQAPRQRSGNWLR